MLLEALPYRKDDVTAGYREEYRRLAGEHGYAVARVDLRGTGSSEGVAADEVPAAGAGRPLPGDRVAGRAAVVDGRGRHVRHSYSGFNSLQVAAERPPALKAVVAIYATDDRYWRHGSLRPAYERIACPTMLVAGWADGYRNATFRVLERPRAPSWLLLGPWSHMATDGSLPGPRIDLVPEMVRWWDRWLRGRRNGVDTRRR